MSRITTEALFASYGRYLRAKVQENETLGTGISFRTEIAAHQELERQYLVQLAADRRAQTEELSAKLDAAEKRNKVNRSGA